MPAPVRALVKAAALAVGMCAVLTGAALAGSQATALTELTLRLGPGAEYDAIASVPEGTEIDVTRCTGHWCRIDGHGNRGWTGIDDITFGTAGDGSVLFGPGSGRTLRGDGTVCFYTGDDFTGRSVCAHSGRVVPDLALHGYDNAFRSVSVEGAASVHVCREFDFGSWCETISKDKPRLGRFLHGAVSSFRVW